MSDIAPFATKKTYSDEVLLDPQAAGAAGVAADQL
jgi:hypothetical protein